MRIKRINLKKKIKFDMFYIALDIEKAGSRISDPIISIGAVLGDDRGLILDKKRLSLKN